MKFPKRNSSISDFPLESEGEINNLKVLIKLNNIRIKKEKDSLKVDYFNGNILIKE